MSSPPSSRGPSDPAPRRPEDRSPLEKLQAVLEASVLDDAELGAFLRREGLHEAQLAEWTELALSALDGGLPRRKAGEDRARIKRLERELRRKDKALAETAALLVLQGKLQALLAEEGDDTTQH